MHKKCAGEKSKSHTIRGLDKLFCHVPGGKDGVVHVEVLVHSKAAAEHHLVLGGGQLGVFEIYLIVFLVIYRIVWLLTLLPGGRVLPCDDRLGLAALCSIILV